MLQVLFDAQCDKDLRVRKIRFAADDATSFKIKVPRTSRAGSNDVLTAELVAARLRKVLRCKQGALSKAMVCWQREQLQWLLHPAQPPIERCGVMANWHSPHLRS